MILVSNLTNDSWLTFDCVKAKMTKGSKIEIADVFYNEPEIQNALKSKLISVVGAVPQLAVTSFTQPKKRRFVSKYPTKLAFDSIKGAVGPGEVIEIPESALNSADIYEAISRKFIVDIDAPVQENQMEEQAKEVLELTEVTSKDIIDTPATKKQEKKVEAVKKVEPKGKIKKLHKASDVEDGDEAGEDLYQESKITTGTAIKQKKQPIVVEVAPMDIEADDVEEEQSFEDLIGEPKQKAAKKSKSNFDFLEVFGDDKEKKKGTGLEDLGIF